MRENDEMIEHWKQKLQEATEGLERLVNEEGNDATSECELINPRRACAARVTVVVLCVCLSVCLSVCQQLFSHYRLRGGL